MVRCVAGRAGASIVGAKVRSRLYGEYPLSFVWTGRKMAPAWVVAAAKAEPSRYSQDGAAALREVQETYPQGRSGGIPYSDVRGIAERAAAAEAAAKGAVEGKEGKEGGPDNGAPAGSGGAGACGKKRGGKKRGKAGGAAEERPKPEAQGQDFGGGAFVAHARSTPPWG